MCNGRSDVRAVSQSNEVTRMNMSAWTSAWHSWAGGTAEQHRRLWAATGVSYRPAVAVHGGDKQAPSS